MSNKPVLITEAGAENLRRGLREIRELSGSGQQQSRRRWPLDDSSTGEGTGGLTIVRVAADGIHEGAEAGNDYGPHLDVVLQQVTYPGKEPILFTFPADYSYALDVGELPGIIRMGYLQHGITISGETITVVTAGSHWIIHNGDPDETDYAVRLNAQEHTDCYSATLKEVHYEDTGDPFIAYPDARTLAAMRGAASIGEFGEYAFPLAIYVRENQFYRAFQSGLGWVVVCGDEQPPLLCRVFSRNWREQRILIDPMKSDTDPSQCGVDGGLDVWSETEYETYFDTASRFIAWAGNNALPEVGDIVLTLQPANCLLPTAIILHKLHPNLPAPGIPGNLVFADLETRCAEPCEDVVAFEDPTWIEVRELDCASPNPCDEVDPLVHGGCIVIGPVLIDEDDPFYEE